MTSSQLNMLMFFTCTSLMQTLSCVTKISAIRPEEQSDPSNSSPRPSRIKNTILKCMTLLLNAAAKFAVIRRASSLVSLLGPQIT